MAKNRSRNTKDLTTKTTNADVANSDVDRDKFQAQQIQDALITRRGPKMNGDGRVDGAIRVLSGDSFNINGDAIVAGDILVPGVPEINVANEVTYKGTVIGNGDTYPNNYKIKLNGNANIGHIITRTNAVAINDVPTVPLPTGTRDLELIKGDEPGDFATVRDLILSRRFNVKLVVPAGTYGVFRAHGSSVFILGEDNKETTYNLQALELNTHSQLQIRGKVTINIKEKLTLNAEALMGSLNKIDDLSVNIETGNATLNSQAIFYGTLNAPAGTLTLNSDSKLIGLAICDQAALNSHSQIRSRDNR